jgi:predicted RND superfamily exporter protein
VVGFGLLAASAVPPNRALGLLVCVNLVVCMLATLCLLPAVGTLRRTKQERTNVRWTASPGESR